VNPTTEPNTFDPGQQTYSFEGAMGRSAFEPLLTAKADLTDVQPAAAESWSVSSDGLTYTFKLRKNAQWSDGKPVVAADFVYGYKRLLNPALTAGYTDPFFDQTIAGAATYGKVDATSASAIDAFLAGLGLSAPDPYTFVIKLAQPTPYFKWVVSLWVAAPIRQDVVESAAGGPFPSTDATKAEAWAQKPATVIGNGPFVFSELVHGDHLTLTPNSHYWGGAPKLQKLIERFITDNNTGLADFKTGTLDIDNLQAANVLAAKSDPTLSKLGKLYPELGTFWLTFNQANSMLANKDLRLALIQSVDRTQIQAATAGTDVPVQTFIPQGMAGYDAALGASQKFDVASAKAHLAASGFTVAQVSTLKLLTRDTTGSRLINQNVISQWSTNLGLNIQLDIQPSHSVHPLLSAAKFDIYGPDGWNADYPDPQDFFDIFTSASCHALNWGCPVLPGYDALVAKADSDTNATSRAAEYDQAQKILVDTGGAGFLYQQYEYDVVQPWVQNLTTSSLQDEYVPGDLSYQATYISKH
jgi:oligopeptide transport system substrate-binding protein